MLKFWRCWEISQGKKFTFYSKNIATGQRNLINISDVRFEINKSLAHVLNRQKDHHGCIKAASAALADNPNSVKVQVIKTLALMRTKNWSKCLDCAKSLQKFCEESDKKLSIIDVMDVKSCMAFSYHKLGHKKTIPRRN